MIVVSGGEPMMQQEGLLPVLERLDSYTIQIHVETAGTIMPIFPIGIRLIRQFNCSPKLATSGNRDTIRYKPAVLAKLNEDYDTWFKFVVTDDWREDFQEIDKIVREVGIPHSRVQVMPEGTAAEETIDLAQTIVSAALERGYGLSMRTHVLLWGDEPGK
jgi:7-carboxy-7-deazaguanine synthase